MNITIRMSIEPILRENNMKRVITGVTKAEESVIVAEGEPGTVVRFGPGFELHELWWLENAPSSVHDGLDPERYSFEPTIGAAFRVVVIPPDADVLSSLARGEKWGANSPYRETGDAYGMHSTSTIDFVSVMSGRVSMQLPDGTRTELAPGDAVVQRGAKHSWRNAGPDPVVLHVTMLGTQHEALPQ